MAGLPASLQVDNNLTVNQLKIDLTKGAAVDFPARRPDPREAGWRVARPRAASPGESRSY